MFNLFPPEPSQKEINEALDRIKERKYYLKPEVFKLKRHPRASMPPRLVRRHKRRARGMVLRELR